MYSIHPDDEYTGGGNIEADNHSLWHAMNGEVVCPWDCGVGEFEAQAEYYESLAEVEAPVEPILEAWADTEPPF